MIRNILTIVFVFFFSLCILFSKTVLAQEGGPMEVVKVKYLNADGLVAGRTDSVYDLNLGPDGNVYVAEYRRNKVTVMDRGLNVLRSIDVTMPHGVVVDKKGFVYVATYDHGRVYKFDGEGKEVPDWDKSLKEQGHTKIPVAMDVDKDGNVYIADWGTKTIILASSDGQFLSAFDTSKIPGGELSPHGVLTDQTKYVYVADRSPAKCVRVFSLAGDYVTQWNIGDQVWEPLAVRFINKTQLGVPDYKSGSIHVFNLDGQAVSTIGTAGRKEGEFLYPMNLIADAEGFFYVVEQDGNRVQKFRLKK